MIWSLRKPDDLPEQYVLFVGVAAYFCDDGVGFLLDRADVARMAGPLADALV